MESVNINGMSCQHCVGSVKEALEKTPGLSNVVVDLNTKKATFDNAGATIGDIKQAINKIGFEAA